MLPDVLCLEVSAAKRILAAVGIFDVKVVLTKAPVRRLVSTAPNPEGIERVLRQRKLEGDRVELVVAHER